MATTYLTRTFNSPTNRKIYTWSAWVKKISLISDHQNAMFGAWYDSSNRSVIRFNGNKLQFQDTANSVDVLTTRLFRDTNAWYHIVIAVDTTQATASNRVKIYVNGVQETVFDTANYPAQNDNLQFNGQDPHYVNARKQTNVDSIADTVYSNINFCDGTQLAPTVFGDTDSTTGEWKIINSPSFTLGNNGFQILKDGNTITDQSSNSNNWTLGAGTLTKTEDNPSNVFATFLPFVPRNVASGDRNPIFSNGNTTALFNNSGYNLNAIGSIALKGKYYWETKWVNANSDSSATTGIVDLSSYDNGFIGTQCVGYEDDGTKINEGSATSYGNSYASGDIIGTAFDSTTGTIWFSKNGVWQNSATISEIASGTTTNSAYTGLSTSVDWLPLATNYTGRVCNVNFGNGYFGTTAVSSAGTNASNNGIFEYDVPTGYTALSTKGLNL